MCGPVKYMRLLGKLDKSDRLLHRDQSKSAGTISDMLVGGENSCLGNNIQA